MSQFTNRSIAVAFIASFFDTEIRAWRGEVALHKVLWVYGVIGGGVMVISYGAALYARRVELQQVLLLCIAGYMVWFLVSVWRCAEETQNAYWGLLARQMTVVWALTAIMVLFFLEVDVAVRFFRS